ncbi:conserved hypothetical protein [Pyrenophora tritici-repentis Pt-1C-BFP]|uniref:Uncharacterized protein n=1 Tax=Pyrenophora tritici-repentis (strain Pt-1C-BFP) TaxID=426418 RepID=B2VRC5_PYRTR|nr:uncharacterized protein PTRG_00106 [Pyrenophora tritici-repentis Pt-1C-BFP]EDU39544.1 conserved hypothetical protein [Pyrenophora tritici-repentis Pt-1C-BFP]
MPKYASTRASSPRVRHISKSKWSHNGSRRERIRMSSTFTTTNSTRSTITSDGFTMASCPSSSI